MSALPERPRVSSNEPWVFYRDREEWSDIDPIPQDDGEHPVVKIAYTEQFSDIYDYLRGAMAKRELSERVLLLTEDAIEMNAANYTVWHYRRLVLKEIDADLREELKFCREMIEENPKNYQVWHHRRLVVAWLGDAAGEKRLTEVIFAQDAKNYHAWEHRQWLLQAYGDYSGELDYTSRLIASDARNNSAWNHRFFVVVGTAGLDDLAVLRRELEYAKAACAAVPANESPWNYLKGLLSKATVDVTELAAEVTQWIWEMVLASAAEHAVPLSASDRATLIAQLPKGAVHSQVLIGLLDMVTRYGGDRAVAEKICDQLCIQDPIRSRYWNFFKAGLSEN